MLRFTLFGFPISIHWMFWVGAGLISGYASAGDPDQVQLLILFILAALVSVLIHELGHAFLMRRYGARASIILHAMGGLATGDRRFTRGQDIIVSLAGPLVEIIFGVAAWFIASKIHGDITALRIFLMFFIEVSIVWGVFNLIPIYPLDGGHVLAGVLGYSRINVTYIVGIVCAAALAVWALSSGRYITTLFLGVLAFENFQRLRGQRPSSLLHPR